jgi:hypothetical protein
VADRFFYRWLKARNLRLEALAVPRHNEDGVGPPRTFTRRNN